MSLSAFLSPRSIAVVGASDDTTKTGGRALDYLSRFEFDGAVYPINPNRDSVQGLRAYKSARHLPEAPDLVIIAVPGEAAVDAVADSAERGIAAAIVTASGFAETGAQGRTLEQRLLCAVGDSGLRIVGPNSQGTANFSNGVVASFSSLYLSSPPADGPVAVISQSGSMSVVPYCQLRDLGIGVRYSIATGNEVDLGVGDFAEAVLADEAVELVLLYIESIRDVSALRRAAETAKQRGVPVVALKAGRSRAGHNAALSHTGALANEDRLVSAFFEQCAFWRARDADELVSAAQLYLHGRRPSGRRLSILTDSGASAVMMADEAEDLGLQLEELPQSTRTKLARLLPEFASTTNPVDMTSVLRPQPELFADVLREVGRANVTDLFMVGFPASGAGYDVPGLARMAAAFCSTSRCAMAVAVPQPAIAAHFRDVGLPTFFSEPEALRGLAQLAKHAELLDHEAQRAEPISTGSLPAPPGRLCHEAESLEFLRGCSLPSAQFELCQTAEAALTAYRTLGPDVVLKACSRELPHKSEQQLVILGISDEASLRKEFEQLSARLRSLAVEVAGIIVAKAVQNPWEFFLGAKHDAVFGPALFVGEGGKFVESAAHIAALLAPVSAAQVRRALQSLPGWHAWQGERNSEAPNLDALCHLASQLSSLIAEHGRQIRSIDLNPVSVGATQDDIVILDALIELNA